jgi:hypothetical protein
MRTHYLKDLHAIKGVQDRVENINKSILKAREKVL